MHYPGTEIKKWKSWKRSLPPLGAPSSILGWSYTLSPKCRCQCWELPAVHGCLQSFNNMDLWETFFNFDESAIWTGEQVHPAVVPNPVPVPNITSLIPVRPECTVIPMWVWWGEGSEKRREGERDQKEIIFLSVKKKCQSFHLYASNTQCISSQLYLNEVVLNMLTENFQVVESYMILILFYYSNILQGLYIALIITENSYLIF